MSGTTEYTTEEIDYTQAYIEIEHTLTVPKILSELGVDLTTRRIYRPLGDFMVYLNQRRFKVIELRRRYVECFVRGWTGEYRVVVDLKRLHYYCSCPHSRIRGALCKHVLLALELYVHLRQEIGDVVDFLREHLDRIVEW